ncbi:MAG: hypothetical protein GY952_14770 [Rhodobacteraceae bacterium]|nr:hypothetical protein [Paracoccaceae bacterium]
MPVFSLKVVALILATLVIGGGVAWYALNDAISGSSASAHVLGVWRNDSNGTVDFVDGGDGKIYGYLIVPTQYQKTEIGYQVNDHLITLRPTSNGQFVGHIRWRKPGYQDKWKDISAALNGGIFVITTPTGGKSQWFR